MGKRFRDNQNKGLENFCVSIIRWATYLILFTPLIISRDSFFPFVTPKTIYFRVLMDIALAAYLILAMFVPRYRPKINALTLSIFIFIGVLVLTSFLGINLERSFWSTFERMTGLLTLFHLSAFFVVLTSVFKKREDWEKILAVSTFAGAILCLYVLTSDELSTRGGGTIGNTSFMATYLLFNIFFALILFFEKKTSGWRIFSGISLLLLITTVLASDARGAKISMYSGFLLVFLGYLIFCGKKNWKKAGLFLISFLIISGIFLAIYQPPFIKDRAETILRQMQPRFVVWEKAWRGFLEKPLFGWGPENFNVVFTKFFNPCMFLGECGSEIWFDRAHNVVLDALATTGVVGLASYLLMFVVAVLGLLWVCVKKKQSVFPALTMAVLLAVYFFQNLLVFDMISSYAVFFLSLAFISFIIEEKEDEFGESEERVTKFVLPEAITEGTGRYIGFGIVIIPMTLLLYFGNIQPFNSAKDTVKMIVADVPLEETIVSYKKALSSFMEKYEVREQFAQKLYRLDFAPQEDREIMESAFALAEAQMEESVKANPLDFRPHLFLGRLYFSDYRFSQDMEKLNLAESTFNKAIELSPTNQQAYWYLTEVKMLKGEQEEAFALFQKAIDLEPRLGRSHWYLAMTYKAVGKYQDALTKIKDAEAVDYYWKNDLDDFRRVTEIYQILGDDESLLLLYQEVLERYPDNAELWANLAASYANLGQTDKAREAAQRVIEIDPSLRPSVEEFLKNL